MKYFKISIFRIKYKIYKKVFFIISIFKNRNIIKKSLLIIVYIDYKNLKYFMSIHVLKTLPNLCHIIYI